VILILGVCAALALRASKGGGGKGKGKDGGYGHTDFGPPRYTYHHVTQYPHVTGNRPVWVWVYPHYQEEKKSKKGWLGCGKGKGKGSTKSMGSQISLPHPYYHHQQPHHYPAPFYPHHHHVPTYGLERLPTASSQVTSYCYAMSIGSHTTSHSVTGR